MNKKYIRYSLFAVLCIVFTQAAWSQQFTKFVRDGVQFNLDGYKDTLKEGKKRTIQLYVQGAGSVTPYITARGLAGGWMYFVSPTIAGMGAGSATLRLLPLDDGEGDYTLTFDTFDQTSGVTATASMSLHVIDRNVVDPSENDLKITNYPNPVTTETTFEFVVPSGGKGSLKLYTLDGRDVMTVFDAVAVRYRYFKTVDVSALPSGTYVYRLKVDGVGDVSGRMVKL